MLDEVMGKFGEKLRIKGRIRLRSDWRAFGVNSLFLLGTHAAKWVQYPLKNETHAPDLRQMARQSERGLNVFELTVSDLYTVTMVIFPVQRG